MARVVVVTGAGSGIGRRIVCALVARGDEILATDVDLAALRKAAGEEAWPSERVSCEELDVRSAEQWGRALRGVVADRGRVDVLVNNAGVLRSGRLQDLEPRDVDFHLDVNAKGLILGTIAAAKLMVPRREGHIVNVASLAGIAPVPGLSLYAASKHAARGFSLSAALELREHGVFVSCVCPDAVATPMLDIQIDRPEAALTFSGGRALTADEVAGAIVDKVLVERPIELALPTTRGWSAKLGSAFPAAGARMLGALMARGRKQQARASRSDR